MTATAAVVDLQEFRTRRAARPQPQAPRMVAPLVPMMVVWVPVMPVR